ncbi:glycoside hydrolase family 16 protein [Rhodonellum sp.]|uniref:glycoside hydrolase family 16 protein n=1 Tax=Rhodonellum sp. TaxID=2231180 RepID=UPI0027158AA8|nr:glycoside hydrolase family 16 protein [Rhodonellum sp.]MDO9554619.1 glycoside hydrolase family 16 protein [Rhodonellum sp.]
MNSCFEIEDKKKTVEDCDVCISPTTYQGYKSIFSEEFNTLTLGESWDYVEGDGCPEECGWGLSKELQFYSKNNIEFTDGNLVIKVKKEVKGQSLYTGGNITTLNNFSFTFGRIDVRAKLPKGQGIWSIVSLLGDDIVTERWPTPGHISLMEMRGGQVEERNNTVVGKLIWGTPNKVEAISDYVSLKNGIFNEKFHVFSVIWEPSKIQWLVNDQVYFEKNIDAKMSETFKKPFHLNLKLAVGGTFPGNPDNSTIFPQEMVVDYVRVFQKE